MAVPNKKSINPNNPFVIYKRKDFNNLGHSSKPVHELADKILRVLRNNVLSGSSKKDVDALLAMFCRQQISSSEIVCFAPKEFHRINSIQRLTELSEDEQKRYLIQIRDNLRFVCHTAETLMNKADTVKDLKTILSFLYEPEYKGAECFGPFLRFPSAETVFIINGYPVITLYGFVENHAANWEQRFFVIDCSDTTDSSDAHVEDVGYNVHNFNDGGDPEPQDEDDSTAPAGAGARGYSYDQPYEIGNRSRSDGENSFSGKSSHGAPSSRDGSSSAGSSASYGRASRDGSLHKSSSPKDESPKKGLETEGGKRSVYDMETDDISNYNTVNTENDPFFDGPSAGRKDNGDTGFRFSGTGGRSDFGDGFRPGDDFSAGNPENEGDEYSETSPFSQLNRNSDRGSNAEEAKTGEDNPGLNAADDSGDTDTPSAEYSALNEETTKDAENREGETTEPDDGSNSRKKNFWFWALVAILLLLLLFLLLWALSFKEHALSFVRFWEPDRHQAVQPANVPQPSGGDPAYVTDGTGTDTSGSQSTQSLTGPVASENGAEAPTGGSNAGALTENTPPDGSSQGGTAGAVPQDGGDGNAPHGGSSAGSEQPLSSSDSPNSSAGIQPDSVAPGALTQSPAGTAVGAPVDSPSNPGGDAPVMPLTEGQSEPAGQNPVFDPTQLSGDKTPFEKLDPGVEEDPGQGYEPAAADDPSLGYPPAAGFQPQDGSGEYGENNPQTPYDPSSGSSSPAGEPPASHENPAAGGMPSAGDDPSANQPSAGNKPLGGQPSAGGNPSSGNTSAGRPLAEEKPSAASGSQSSGGLQTSDGSSAAEPAQSDTPAAKISDEPATAEKPSDKKQVATLYYSNDYSYIRIKGKDGNDVLRLKHNTDSSKDCIVGMQSNKNSREYTITGIKGSCANPQYVPSQLVKCSLPSAGASMCKFVDSHNVETPFYVRLEQR